MDNLYLVIYNNCDNDLKEIEVNLESLIIIFIYKYCDINSFKLNLVVQNKPENEPSFAIDLTWLNIYEIIKENQLPKLATYCVLPVAVINNITVISGLCSVSRQIIKNGSEGHDCKKLLGFREACLMACNESSVWTKFCEVDIITSIKDIFKNPDNYFTTDTIKIPKDLTRFECHMSQPVRIHNMYKVAQDQAKLNNKNASDINTTIAKKDLDLNHLYGEGPYMTLADIVLYPCIYIFSKVFNKFIFDNNLPLTKKWYDNMSKEIIFLNIKLPINLASLSIKEGKVIIQEKIEKLSLYVSDPQRYKPRNRIFTKQPDILNALNIIKELQVEIKISEQPHGHEIEFDWSKVPMEANPKGGALPVSRMKRKCEQLENLAKAVMKMGKPGDIIVDFCSGSGHLGILLAVQLVDCKIILLENKEASLSRAKARVESLKLKNITFLQCNLDYFHGNFDIGVSLHACGVATDLVIQHCLRRNAAFICCPCCYGGVHNCHHITYPRSTVFKNCPLTLRDYLVLGHSADQTHDAENIKTKQGIQCMNIIDTDRKLQANELGYDVKLSKMIPVTCTPKNNILIGFPNN